MSRKKPGKPLPAMHRGAIVVRGAGMKADDVDKLLDEHALDQWDAANTTYLVVADDLESVDSLGCVKLFLDKKIAIKYAQALSNGNVDHRVLTITTQSLVVATDNDL